MTKQKVFFQLIVIVSLFICCIDICIAEEAISGGEPTGEITSNKWNFVIAAYGLSWLGLLGYLLSLYKRGLR